MTDKDHRDTRMAILYELRLMISDDSKTEYTKEEILNLLDKIARVQDQK